MDREGVFAWRARRQHLGRALRAAAEADAARLPGATAVVWS